MNHEQIIKALDAFISKKSVNFVAHKFKTLRKDITVNDLIKIDESELFEALPIVDAIEFVKFQERMKKINKHGKFKN